MKENFSGLIDESAKPCSQDFHVKGAKLYCALDVACCSIYVDDRRQNKQ